MHSCIYEGLVRHRRFSPLARQFGYRLFLVYLDLAEADLVFGRRGIWPSKLRWFANFRRADHCGPSEVPLDVAVRDLVEARLGWRPGGPIRLLTHLRYCGWILNPVSFYYCFSRSEDRVEAVMAEVTNTPWGERHCYVLDLRKTRDGAPLGAQHAKEMHVSPFLPMDLHYRWRLSAPGRRLVVGIDCLRGAERVFAAALALHRRPLTRSRLALMQIRYPMISLQVLARIYWQALLIWLRGVPFVPHPDRPDPIGRGAATRTAPQDVPELNEAEQEKVSV